MPKYMTQILEGALISEYYQEKEKDHDVIFVGDCEVYESFHPLHCGKVRNYQLYSWQCPAVDMAFLLFA